MNQFKTTQPLAILLAALNLTLSAQVSLDPPHLQTINRYCTGCHAGKSPAAKFNLATLPSEPELWEKVIVKLSTRQMPPLGSPRPDQAAYDSLLSVITGQIDRTATLKPNPGRTDTFRRLNRTEYRNSIRDLLAVDFDFSSLLPSDETSLGFDNITVGELSPILLERYLSAAHKVSRLAIGSPVRSPGGETILIPPDLTQEDQVDGLPFGTRGGAVVKYNFPLDAEYEIQFRLARDRDERVEGLLDAHQVELRLDGERIKLFQVKPPPRGTTHEGVDKQMNVRIPVKAGPHSITVAFTKRTSALLETERQPYIAHFNADRHPRPQPALYSVSILGPYNGKVGGDSPSRSRIFVCRPSNPASELPCAKQILSTLMRRAYRRPVTDADLIMPLQFFNHAKAEGGFEGGIEMALRALLVNPNFLFRIERDPREIAPQTSYRLTDLEIATRLSFFLWSSIPDDPLLDAAIAGRLKSPAALDQQVRRMLADGRSKALVNNFAAQWLYLRNLDSANPDPRLFADFDDNLRQSFRKETELFVESVFREDRNVLDLLRAKYSFLNERLAKHYGIPHIYGSRFRKVEFSPASERGGLLSHGSILTVTSYATRTSPVIRGKWILTNILGTPPAPPPPDVPQLKETSADGKLLPMRERVAMHRANPACASCHNLMDPVGFALENYDAIGRHRNAEESGTPIDASGILPDGTKFQGATELQNAILARPELFVQTLTGKLMTYALGRGVEFYDAPATRKIVRGAAGNDFRFSSLIMGIVSSPQFQMRRSL